ncbi:hypothetical protein [Amycolatopsis sp. NPDC004378]
MSTTDRPEHIVKAEGLFALAAFVEQNPELAEHFRHTIEDINIPVSSADDPVSLIAAFTRAGLAAGATVTKEYSENHGGVTISWGAVGIHVYAARDQVCERIVTGTETVTRRVPDPAAPLVEVTEEVETVEWRCRPLLAAEQSSTLTPELLAEAEHWAANPLPRDPGATS